MQVSMKHFKIKSVQDWGENILITLTKHWGADKL